MPRKPRIDQPGLLYHIIARGIERRHIYADDDDRRWFLGKLGRQFGSSRIRAVSDARACLAARMVTEYGLSRKETARRLNVSHTAVAKMLDRNRTRDG